MYVAFVVGMMLVLPAVSVAVEALQGQVALSAMLMAKWLVFWGVGWRLLVAGIRQIVQPRFTATLLGLRSDEALVLVRELGFWNAAIGVAAITSIAVPGWRLALALAGGLFFLMAGINHALRPRTSAHESDAMTTDLLLGVALLGTCAAALAA